MSEHREGSDWKTGARSKFEEFLEAMEKAAMTRTFAELEQLAAQFRTELGLDLLRVALMGRADAKPDVEHSCPKCGAKLRVQERAQRRLLKTGIGDLEYLRPYTVCDRCGHTGCLLDQALGIPRAGPSIGALEKICHAAVTTRSFEVACDVLKVHDGMRISRKHVRSLAESEGRRLVEQRSQRLEQFRAGRARSRKQRADELLVVTCDGGRVQIRGTGNKDNSWREDKIGVVYDAVPYPHVDSTYEKYRGAKAQTKTYVGTIESWESFGWLLRMEAEDRGYGQARCKVFVADGSPWIREVQEGRFPDAKFVLDWPHASEHLSACSKALFGAGTNEAHSWYRSRREELWEGGSDEIIVELDRFAKKFGEPEPGESEDSPRVVIHRNATSYFPLNAEAMNYPWFRSEGWPIASGVAEGSVNQFGIRLKGACKFWNLCETGAEEMLALCALHHSEDGRWQRHWRIRGQT